MGTPAPWGSIDNPTISHIMKRLQVFYGRPLLFIDFEFNSSQEPMLNLVCGDMILSDQEETIDGYWLKDDPTQKRTLKNLLLSLRKKNPIIVSYMAVAEARSFLALGIDPHQFDWIDLYAEWRQLTFNNESCEYGTIFSKNGFRLHSVPPSYRKEFNKGRCNTKVGMGMVDCVGQMFGVFIDSLHKNEMRDLIISNPPEFTPTEKKAILDYCASDVLPLPHMMLEMLQRLQQTTKIVKDDIIRAQLKRGRYMASVAKMESVGLPINVGKARNLRNNFESAREAIISDLVENHYPFYVRKKIGPKSKGFVGDWVETYSAFVSFLTEKHPKLLRVWPKTVNKDTGKTSDRYSLEDKVMGGYDGIPEIYAYRQAKKNIRQMSWFKEPDEKKKKKSGDFFDSVGSDGRVRTFLGSYGTQTSRNAPKASRFVLAMSSWLRCLIEPPEGKAVAAPDYGSQEFAIAAIKSKDPNMIEAYRSGDPYLFFAKCAGAVPWEADGKKCKEPAFVLSETPWINFPHGVGFDEELKAQEENPELFSEYQKHCKYKEQRDLAKSLVLGLQFGMGVVKLALKLSADMGRFVSEQEAGKLLAIHKKTFKVFWAWVDRVITTYRRRKVLILQDGWALLGDNDNDLSVKNFPVQGTGAVIMREAVKLSHQMSNKDLDIISPLHDALYCLVDEDKAEEQAKVLVDNMQEAVRNVLGNSLEIRIDMDIHRRGDIWIEPKGKRFYALLSKYLEPMEKVEDQEKNFIGTICSF